MNKVLVHWSRAQFSCALVHFARAPLRSGQSPEVLHSLRAYNPMSLNLLRTFWLLAATPVASRSSQCRVVAEVVEFLRAHSLYIYIYIYICVYSIYKSWIKVVTTVRYFCHGFIHREATFVYFQYCRPQIITFCQMFGRRRTSSVWLSLLIFRDWPPYSTD